MISTDQAPVTPQHSQIPGFSDPNLATEIDELDVEIAELESGVSNFRNKRAFYYFLLSFAALCLAVALFANVIFAGFEGGKYVKYAQLLAFFGIVYCLGFTAYFMILRQSRLASMKQELDVLRAKRRIAARNTLATSEGAPPSYFDRLVDINVTNLEAYYGLVKVHTNNSFQVAISAGCVGFVFIITGLIIGFTNLANAQAISYMSAGAGIVTEFISGVFFYLYNRTVRQLKEYHDSLIQVQNILLSFKIVGDTRDENRKNVLMELMMKCLIAPKPGIVSASEASATTGTAT
jgi:hypothetical protein